MQEENIAIRLKYLINELGITNSVFAENCGISRATLSQLLTGRNKKISDIIIGQIHEAYPTLSILWLLFNEGDMWNGTHTANDGNNNEFNQGNYSTDGNEHRGNDKNHLYPKSDDGNSMKYTSENAEIPTSGQSGIIDGKENALKHPSFMHHFSQDESVNNCIKTAELLNEIENLKKKTRKVVQITVYYDDSTFESFFPGKNR